eukprot:3399124-Pyramimonas_sp.AAC.1
MSGTLVSDAACPATSPAAALPTTRPYTPLPSHSSCAARWEGVEQHDHGATPNELTHLPPYVRILAPRDD